MILELIREAVRNLARHKLRSLLTVLGIVFGIASVVSMVATGEGARRSILAQIQELGIRNIIINARKPPAESDVQDAEQGRVMRYGLTFHDARQLERTVPSIDRVLPVHDLEAWIWFKSRRLEAKVRGVTPDYLAELGLVPTLGRTLTRADGLARKRVCVVRRRLLKDARYVGDPLKLDLKIGNDFFRVCGVLPDVTFQSTNAAVLGIDGRALEVYVPFETVLDRYGLMTVRERAGSQETARVELHQIVCTTRVESDVIPAAYSIQSVLAKFHERKDYEVVVPLKLLESRQRAQSVFNIFLPVIAGISLIVGGIGILNIMLASVVERTREIGIRRAIGCTRSGIVWQFLIETVTLAAIGGILGVALGVVGVFVIDMNTDWSPRLTPWAVSLSLGISCLTGIVFGLYPAARAARMDPIRALRHE